MIYAILSKNNIFLSGILQRNICKLTKKCLTKILSAFLRLPSKQASMKNRKKNHKFEKKSLV